MFSELFFYTFPSANTLKPFCPCTVWVTTFFNVCNSSFLTNKTKTKTSDKPSLLFMLHNLGWGESEWRWQASSYSFPCDHVEKTSCKPEPCLQSLQLWCLRVLTQAKDFNGFSYHGYSLMVQCGMSHTTKRLNDDVNGEGVEFLYLHAQWGGTLFVSSSL